MARAHFLLLAQDFSQGPAHSTSSVLWAAFNVHSVYVCVHAYLCHNRSDKSN